jgi:toluene monooxygenase system protein B
MDEIAAAAAHHSVGRRVAAQPDKVLRVRRQGDNGFFPRTAKLSETQIKPMETLEFIFAEEQSE